MTVFCEASVKQIPGARSARGRYSRANRAYGYDKPFPGRLTENTARDMDRLADLYSPNPQAASALGCSVRYQHSLTGEPRCYIYLAPDYYLRPRPTPGR